MRNTWLWTPVILVGLAAGAYGAYRYYSPPPLARGVVYANGHIEGTEVDVSAEVSGRVVESNLTEGAKVGKGDTLVVLDSSGLKTRLAQAGADAAAIKSEKARIAAELEIWRHHLRTTKADLERFQQLRERGTAAQQRLDQAQNAYQEARGREAALTAEAAAIGARLEAANRQIEYLQLQVEKTVIRAPISGTVLVKAIEIGELAQPGRIVATLVDLGRMELKVYVREADIGKLQLGNPAKLRVDSFPDRYFAASVARIDQQAQFTPRDIHMPDERARTVYGVTLAVPNPEEYLKPGMPADAWILWQDGEPWPERLVTPVR